MTIDDLTTLLRSLLDRNDPLTGKPASPGSCLYDTDIRRGLEKLLDHIGQRRRADTTISLTEVTDLCAALREMEYRPTVMQLAKIFIGSRSIADPRLRGLPAYRRYRGVLTRSAVRDMLLPHESLITGTERSVRERRKTGEEAWQEIDFFATELFDKLSEAKATELFREVEALGLRKVTERLPAYMVKARVNLPRAFEPWTREERALLIEAMCYTNEGEKLASIFGRSKSSVQREGKRLIWESQQKRQVA